MTRQNDTINKVSDAELEAFVLAAQEKTGLRLGYEIGQRYARIFSYLDAHDDRQVFAFIDLTNGNVLRTHGWKSPNLKVRNSIQGNVFDAHRGSGAVSAEHRWRGL
jgi:hypothetical protein